MNKYEMVSSCRENYEMGFYRIEEVAGMIIDKWCEENGGRMDNEDTIEMVEYIEEVEWMEMASFMQGYFWGACIDDQYELMGANAR